MTEEAVAWIEGPQQRLYLLPVFLLPFAAFVAIWLEYSEGGLAFPTALAVAAIVLTAYIVGMARWFVEVLPSEVRYRNRWRTETVALGDVVDFEVVSVRGIPLLSDVTVVQPSAVAACVAMRLRTGRLVPLLATMKEWAPGTAVAKSYCARLQAVLDDLRRSPEPRA